MKPKDCFGIVIRAFSRFVLLLGFYYLLVSVYVFVIPGMSHKSPLTAYMANGFTLIIISLYLLRGAPALIRFCYPDSEQKNQSDND